MLMKPRTDRIRMIAKWSSRGRWVVTGMTIAVAALTIVGREGGDPFRRDESDLAAMLFVVYGIIPSIGYALLDLSIWSAVGWRYRYGEGKRLLMRAAGFDAMLVVAAWVLTQIVVLLS